MVQQIVTYRHIPKEEWERLRALYESNGDVLPNPDTATAVIAEFNGEIIGLNGIRSIVHGGPRWVHPKWRRMGIALKMGVLAEEVMRNLGAEGYLIFPSNAASIALAERLGLERKPWAVFGRTL